MADRINVGGLQADIQLEHGDLEQVFSRLTDQIDKVAAEILRLQGEFLRSGGAATGLADQINKLIGEKQRLISQADAIEAAAMREIEATAKAAANHEQWAAKAAAIDEEMASRRQAAQNVAVNAVIASLAREEAAEDRAEARENARLEKMLADYESFIARKQAIAEKQAVANWANVGGENWNPAQMTVQAVKIQELISAENADVIAKRQMANAADGAAREQAHLNSVIQAGVSEMNTEATAIMQATVATTHYTAAAGAAGGAMGAGGNAAGHLSRGLMQLGYIIDDVRYGFSAIVNNTAPLIYSFVAATGASAAMSGGIAAGVQIAVVAGYELYTQWDKVQNLMGMGRVLSEAEEMKALGEQTAKTAEETAKLARYKKEEAEIAALMATRPKSEQERAKAVGEAITEGDSEKIVKGIFEAKRAGGRGAKLTPEEEAAVRRQSETTQEDIEAPGVANLFGLMLNPKKRHPAEAKLEDQKSKSDMAAAEKLMQRARTDPNATRELMTIVGGNPGAFPPGFLKDLEDTLPENVKQQKEFEAQGRVNASRFETEDEKRKASEKEFEDTAAWQEREADKEDREEKKLAKDEQHRAREWRKQNQELAHTLVPELDSRVADEVLLAKVQGRDMASVEKIVAEGLEKAEMSPEDAKVAAKDVVASSSKEVDKKIAKGAYEGETRNTMSQIFGTSDLTRAIQGGIGGDNGAKAQRDKMVDLLTEIARDKGLKVTVE